MASSLRRHIMMQQGGGGGLPSEYQQVEYLENTGSSHIFIPENIDVLHSTFEIDFAYASDANYYSGVFGNATYFHLLKSGNTTLALCLNSWSGSIVFPYSTPNGTRIKAKFVCDAPSFYGKFDDGTNISERNATKSISSQTKNGYYLFYIGSSYRMKGKIFSFSITNESKSYNLIPCYRKADNVAGMYDIVNDVFYTNAGTGSFIVGPDV